MQTGTIRHTLIDQNAQTQGSERNKYHNTDLELRNATPDPQDYLNVSLVETAIRAALAGNIEFGESDRRMRFSSGIGVGK